MQEVRNKIQAQIEAHTSVFDSFAGFPKSVKKQTIVDKRTFTALYPPSLLLTAKIRLFTAKPNELKINQLPDIDNITKTIFDVIQPPHANGKGWKNKLNEGKSQVVVYLDDKQIVSTQSDVYYVDQIKDVKDQIAEVTISTSSGNSHILNELPALASLGRLKTEPVGDLNSESLRSSS